MPWCPECGYEYAEGASVCPDCRAALVDERPAASPEPLERARARQAAKSAGQPAAELAVEPGPWCPNCGTQYRPGATVCTDCGAALVSEPPAEILSRSAEAHRPFLPTLIARLRGASDLPPSFIERFLAVPETRWNAAFALFAAFSLMYARQSPPALYQQLPAVFYAAPWLGWAMAGAGLLRCGLAGIAAGALVRRRPWLYVGAAALLVWAMSSSATSSRGYAPQPRPGFEWLTAPGFVALAACYLAAAIGMAVLGGNLTHARRRALVVAVAVAFFWREGTTGWVYAVERLIPWTEMRESWMWLRWLLTIHDVAIGVGLAAIGLGWIVRRDGWLLGAALGILAAFSRTTYPNPSSALARFGLCVLLGLAGGWVGQVLVAGFHRWQRRSAGVWPAVVKGVLTCAALSAFVGFPHWWLVLLIGSILGAGLLSQPQSIIWWGTGVLGALVAGAAIGRLFYRSPRMAGALAAGATFFTWASYNRWGVDEIARRLTYIAVLSAAAYAVAWLFQRRAERPAPPMELEEEAASTAHTPPASPYV